jgi:hypothetical protein
MFCVLCADNSAELAAGGLSVQLAGGRKCGLAEPFHSNATDSAKAGEPKNKAVMTSDRWLAFISSGSKGCGAPWHSTGAEAVKRGAVRRNDGGESAADIVLGEARPKIADGDGAGKPDCG